MYLLGEIRTRFKSPDGFAECLDAAWMKPVIGACSQAERAELSRCMEWLFAKWPLLQSTPQPKEDPTQARILKPEAKIEARWNMIFARQRMTEPDDRRPIHCQELLSHMWTDWYNAGFPENLTTQQKQ